MPSFTAADVLIAFGLINKEGIPKGFGPSTKWDVIDPTTLEPFPPKAVLFLAKQHAGDTSHSGGGGDVGTNNALRERGFKVVLKPHLEESEQAQDIEALIDADIDPTTREQLINARLGQGGFRQALMEIWDAKCALTALDVEAVLKASHIKAWRDSDDSERLDPHNGLLLAANVDALFDRYLISFDDDGALVVRSTIAKQSLEKIGLRSGDTIALKAGNRAYLAAHRAKFSEQGSSYRF